MKGDKHQTNLKPVWVTPEAHEALKAYAKSVQRPQYQLASEIICGVLSQGGSATQQIMYALTTLANLANGVVDIQIHPRKEA